jgi:RNA polymerase sigma factor (sigma-70 family)
MPRSLQELDQLVLRACAGDAASLESLLLHYHDALLGVIRKEVAKGASAGISAEDVLQEALMEAFRSVKTLEARGGAAFFAWLKTIARSRLLNMAKARRAQKRRGNAKQIGRGRRGSLQETTAITVFSQLAGPDPTPSWIARRKEAVSVLMRALGHLDKERQAMMELRYGQSLSIEEIAGRTGKSEGAVKMVINRSLKELRTMIGPGNGKSSVS